MSAGRSAAADSARAAAERGVPAPRLPSAQLRVAPTSRGSRLARMSSRRDTAVAAAPLSQRATAAPGRGPRTSAAAPTDTDGQASQWMRGQGKKQPARRPQRVRTLKLKTQVHPEALMPYLYGERGSSINAIMNETGCSIDYCALSPDDMDDQAAAMQGRPHTMTFLVSAETTGMLEEGSHRLRLLVNRVQTHVQRRMKAQNIYERQERQTGSSAKEVARAAMFAEDQSARMDALERDAGMVDLTGQQQHPSSTMRRQEVYTSERKLRVGPADSDRSQLREAAHSPAAHFPVRSRGTAGVRFAHSSSSEPYQEMMWSRPEPNIYYMDERMQFPRQRPRYTDVVDVEQPEMKTASPAPESTARPAKSIRTPGESLLSAGDGEVRPYIRRRLHGSSSEQTRQGFTPPQPRLRSPYGEQELLHAGMRRSMKRPLRRQPLPAADQDAFAEIQRFHESDGADRQDMGDAASSPDEDTSANAEASAAMPVRLESLGLAEDVDEDWVTTAEPRRYRRPILGYYVRTLDGYVEPVAPPADAYFYGRPQAVYGDYFEYGDAVEWISDEDEGMYAYEYPPRHEQLSRRELPSDPRAMRQFVRPGSRDGYRMWAIPDRAPTRLVKRRKMMYGDLREHERYQPESDSAPEERPAVVDAPPSDEEIRPQTDSRSGLSSTSSVVASSGLESVRADEDRDAPSSMSISEGEENKSGNRCKEPGSSMQPLPAATDTNEKPVEQEVEDVPIVSQPLADSSEIGSQFKTDGGSPVRVDASDQIEDVDVTPAVSASIDAGAFGRDEEDSSKIARGISSEVPSSGQSFPRDEATDRLGSSSIVAEEATGTEGSRTESHGDGDTTVIDASGAPNETSVTSKATVAVERVASDSDAVPLDHRAVIVSSPRHVDMPITASMTMNDRLSHSLENMNRCEADLIRVKENLASQKERYLSLQQEEHHQTWLQVLLAELIALQCRLAASDSVGFGSLKHEMLTAIQALFDHAAESDEPTESKVEALRKGLETLMSVQATISSKSSHGDANEGGQDTRQAQEDISDDASNAGSTHADNEVVGDRGEATGEIATRQNPTAADFPDGNQPNGGDASGQEPATKPSGADRGIKREHEVEDFVVKQEVDSSDCPPGLPRFLWAFLTQSLASDASHASYVMRVMYKRLLEEIAKSNPYYYLHRNMLHPRTARASGSALCEFGCRGASATKWERKLISQINSRMKSFDNIAYSLARSAGGKDVLNRKKLNSIIRKLHLVAMQVHSLLSHLYCLKGRVVCSEADAMSSALNNSHFEKRMGIYKSRLRLVFPHKQQPIGASVSKEPEDLVRDTFEFFPELLVCVDIWGYNYREALIKRQRARDTIILTADGVPSEPAQGYEKLHDAASLLPQSFFRTVEGKAFDFDNDGNGLLRCICDELLNIVCLWNDFKWLENLETLDLDSIIAFENGVGSSIAKILGLYAHHLEALWAAHIRADPEYLRSVRLTQHNAYYTPHSHLSFPLPRTDSSTDCSSIALPLETADLAPDGSRVADTEPVKESESDADEAADVNAGIAEDADVDMDEDRDADAAEEREVDEGELCGAVAAEEAAPTSEARVVEAYWTRKRGDGMGQARDSVGGSAHELTALAVPDDVANWDELALASHLLDGGKADALRSTLDELSTVASELLRPPSDAADPVRAAHRCHIVSSDIVRASEKLALHSAALQMREEAKQQQPSTPRASSEAASPPSSVASPAPAARRSRRRREVDEAWSPPPSLVSALSDHSALEGEDEACVRGALLEDEDQPVGDVIEVLAAARRELRELTAQRARSARVREKLQLHAVALARQAAELVRNTAQMYT